MSDQTREPARAPEELAALFNRRANAGDVEGLVALYEPDGRTMFWPVHQLDLDPPAARRPRPGEVTDLDGAISAVVQIFV